MIEFEGHWYRSMKQLCEEKGCSYSSVANYRKQGFSLDAAVAKACKKRYFYDGQYYATQKELAEKGLGVSYRVFTQSPKYSEIRSTLPIRNKGFEANGHWFANKEDLYKSLGISGSGIRKRAIKRGISTEEMLAELINERFPTDYKEDSV